MEILFSETWTVHIKTFNCGFHPLLHLFKVKMDNAITITMPTSEGAVSQSQNNNEDQNAPIVVNQGGTNTDTQQSTSSYDED